MYVLHRLSDPGIFDIHIEFEKRVRRRMHVFITAKATDVATFVLHFYYLIGARDLLECKDSQFFIL